MGKKRINRHFRHEKALAKGNPVFNRIKIAGNREKVKQEQKTVEKETR
jgi:hypothetical protein